MLYLGYEFKKYMNPKVSLQSSIEKFNIQVRKAIIIN